MTQSIVLKNPCDFHVHLRGAFTEAGYEVHKKAMQILDAVLPLQVPFAQVLAMPNIQPNHVKNYRGVIGYMMMLETGLQNVGTHPLLTISLKSDTTPEVIDQCARWIKAVKYYPGGVTTGSGDTSPDIDPNDPEMKEIFDTMAKNHIVLSLHPETTKQEDEFGHITKGFVGSAEREFRSIAEQIAINHPDLRIVIEHISTKEMANLVASGKYPNVYGTVTPQHLLFTAHDKEGGHTLNPHLHCKPTLKNPEDLFAIQRLVFSGNPHVFFGSDSAPHPQSAKESSGCASGVFSSPIALQAVTSWFMDERMSQWYWNATGVTLSEGQIRENLQNFLSSNGQAVYGKPVHTDKFITLEQKGFTVAQSYETNDPSTKIVPMLAGKPLSWSITEIVSKTQGVSERILDLSPLKQLPIS